MHFIRKYSGFFIVAVVLLLFVLDIISGQIQISLSELFAFISGKLEEENAIRTILIEIRFPKAIAAFFIGGGLAVSGLLLQTLFRNPLADPYILGISSGAGLGVAIFTMAGGYSLMQFVFLGVFSSALFASLGAFFITFLVISISAKIQNTVSLLLIGVMFGSLSTSIVALIQYFTKAELVQLFQIWTFGSLNAISWAHLWLLIPVILFGLFAALSLIIPLNSILLNEKYAISLGVNIKRLRIIIILITSLITGVATAFAGPIGFVGMAIPHISRNILDTSNHKRLIPYSFLAGAALLMLCDIISQLPVFDAIIPINSVLALFGAPVVIWVIIKSSNSKFN